MDLSGTAAHGSPEQSATRRGSETFAHALRQLEIQLNREIAEAQERAERAEAQLARAQDELAQVTVLYEEQRRAEGDRLSQVAAGVRVYLDATRETEQTLLELTRQLLTMRGAPSRAASPAPDPDLDAPDAAPLADEHVTDEHVTDEHVTDEHRLIDLRNRLDMERLDIPSRLATPIRRWRASPIA